MYVVELFAAVVVVSKHNLYVFLQEVNARFSFRRIPRYEIVYYCI
jgi:hypothetical protein